MNTEYAITFDAQQCIACHGCVVACKAWRNLPPGIFFRRVEKIWQQEAAMPRLRHASVACQHCADPACMAACPVGAIAKNADGLVLVDETTCIGCRSCEEACPFDVPQFSEEGGFMFKCDLCTGLFDAQTQAPPCVATCPTQALKLVRMTPEEKKEAESTQLALLHSGML